MGSPGKGTLQGLQAPEFWGVRSSAVYGSSAPGQGMEAPPHLLEGAWDCTSFMRRKAGHRFGHQMVGSAWSCALVTMSAQTLCPCHQCVHMVAVTLGKRMKASCPGMHGPPFLSPVGLWPKSSDHGFSVQENSVPRDSDHIQFPRDETLKHRWAFLRFPHTQLEASGWEWSLRPGHCWWCPL